MPKLIENASKQVGQQNNGKKGGQSAPTKLMTNAQKVYLKQTIQVDPIITPKGKGKVMEEEEEESE